MNDSASPQAPHNMSRDEMMSALFGHMVIQNTQMALMFLGQAPHPETNERMHDLEAARMFIDQLEMLEVKTKGNLSREEEKLLQQSLMHLRMSFVQVMENPPPSKAKEAEIPRPAEPSPEQAATEPAVTPGQEEPRKRFSKKF